MTKFLNIPILEGFFCGVTNTVRMSQGRLKNNRYHKSITESVPDYFFVYDIHNKKKIYLSDSFRNYRFSDEGSDLDQMRAIVHEDYQPVFDELFEDLKKVIISRIRY